MYNQIALKLIPITIAGSDSGRNETQPWVSSDELTLLFNRRGEDAITSLIKMTRPEIDPGWGNPSEVSITGFADASGMEAWGEPSLPRSGDSMIFIRFNTSQLPWRSDIMYAPGNPEKGFGPAVKLN